MEHELLNVEREIAEIRSDVSGLQEQCKTLFNQQARQDKLTDSVQSLATSMQKMASEQKHMSDDVKGLRSDVDDLKAKPGKRWEAIVEKAVLTIVAAVIGYMLAQIGIV